MVKTSASGEEDKEGGSFGIEGGGVSKSLDGLKSMKGKRVADPSEGGSTKRRFSFEREVSETPHPITGWN